LPDTSEVPQPSRTEGRMAGNGRFSGSTAERDPFASKSLVRCTNATGSPHRLETKQRTPESATRRIPSFTQCEGALCTPSRLRAHINPRIALSPMTIATNQTPSNPMRGRSLAVFGSLAGADSGCGTGAAAATCLGAGASSTSSTPT
jgi:hypothetical protein